MPFDAIGRREVIALLGGASITPFLRPFPARAQPALPIVGFLSSGSLSGYRELLVSYRKGLAELGYVEGQNVTIEYRWAEGHFERNSALAVELVARRPAVIVTAGLGSALGVRKASTTIPLVFLAGDDPVKFGLTNSLNRPNGNATGVAWLTSVLLAKRLELARGLVPSGALIGVLMNPSSPESESQLRDIETAARTIGQRIQFAKASSREDFETAFVGLAKDRVAALIVSNDAFFNSERNRIVEQAARHRIPAFYDRREYAVAGGLICYGASYPLAYRELGIYTGKILKGAKPADLPIMQPTNFEFVINLKTAKALGLTIPDKILALADEVIE